MIFQKLHILYHWKYLSVWHSFLPERIVGEFHIQTVN